MLIIPAINCKNLKCVKERLEMAADFLPSASGRNKNKRWVQIDISDGKFTKAKSWNNPEKFKILNLKCKINTEVHLMVNNLKPNVLKWLKIADRPACAGRIIFHFENFDENEFKFLKEINKKNKVKFGIAITTKTPVEIIVPFLNGFTPTPKNKGYKFVKGINKENKSNNLVWGFKFVQLLAVNPGFSGQKFNKETIKKIKFLKKNYPKVVVEIDGGINPQTARLVKKAGADIINSGSYIFNSKNPKEAYQKLSGV